MEAINLIRNCRVKFRKVCPQRWEQLAPTAAERVRFCETCSQQVFLCETDEDALAHARAGHCIAKPIPDLSALPAVSMVLGMPRKPQVPPRMPTREERLLKEEAARESAKTKALRDIEYASRTCPRCGYPCADWLTACEVCGQQTPRLGRAS